MIEQILGRRVLRDLPAGSGPATVPAALTVRRFSVNGQQYWRTLTSRGPGWRAGPEQLRAPLKSGKRGLVVCRCRVSTGLPCVTAEISGWRTHSNGCLIFYIHRAFEVPPVRHKQGE